MPTFNVASFYYWLKTKQQKKKTFVQKSNLSYCLYTYEFYSLAPKIPHCMCMGLSKCTHLDKKKIFKINPRTIKFFKSFFCLFITKSRTHGHPFQTNAGWRDQTFSTLFPFDWKLHSLSVTVPSHLLLAVGCFWFTFSSSHVRSAVAAVLDSALFVLYNPLHCESGDEFV